MIKEEYLNQLLGVMEQFGVVSPSLRLLLSKSLIDIELVKGQTLLFKNEIPKNFWFVITGMGRALQLINGVEKTVWFWFSGDFIFTNPGFFTQKPAHYNVEITEHSHLLYLSYQSMVQITTSFPVFNAIIEGIRDEHSIQLMAHIAQLKDWNCQDRFDFFYDRHKRVFNFLPIKYIADFLAIHPHNICRYMR